MIKVNLIGAGRKKKSARTGGGISLPTNAMPFVLLLIVAGTAAGGYFWYSSLNSQLTSLNSRIALAQAEKAKLDKVITENQAYEGKKKALENRIKIIEGLKRNQVNPVLAMDVLSEAIDRTQYVWLSSLDQNNAILSMSGTGTSLNAIADFVSNLQRSGYFRNSELANATDSSGNFTFSLRCEFAPPVSKTTPPAAPGGGN